MTTERVTSGREVHPGGAVVELHLRELDQLFNNMDPAPFHEKGLDPDAEGYILSRAREFLKDASLALVVYLDRPAALLDKERVLGDAIRSHFARRSLAAQRRLRQLFHEGRISLVIGLVFLAACLITGETIAALVDQTPWTTVLRESFVIGGWVAMWRPLEICLYDWWPILGQRRLYDRLSRVTVRVVYTGTLESQNRKGDGR